MTVRKLFVLSPVSLFHQLCAAHTRSAICFEPTSKQNYVLELRRNCNMNWWKKADFAMWNRNCIALTLSRQIRRRRRWPWWRLWSIKAVYNADFAPSAINYNVVHFFWDCPAEWLNSGTHIQTSIHNKFVEQWILRINIANCSNVSPVKCNQIPTSAQAEGEKPKFNVKFEILCHVKRVHAVMWLYIYSKLEPLI